MSNSDYARLAELEEIKKLRIVFSHLVDRGDIDRWSMCFTEDAIIDVGSYGAVGQESGGTLWKGREQIRRNVMEVYKRYDEAGEGTYPFVHAITNHWVEFTGPDTAEGRAYLLDWIPARKEPLQLIGVYLDEYRKEDGSWRIARSAHQYIWPHRNGVLVASGKKAEAQ
jgi:hypothetical protein